MDHSGCAVSSRLAGMFWNWRVTVDTQLCAQTETTQHSFQTADFQACEFSPHNHRNLLQLKLRARTHTAAECGRLKTERPGPTKAGPSDKRRWDIWSPRGRTERSRPTPVKRTRS